MVDVWAQAGSARIEEGWIEAKDEFVAGLCEAGYRATITLNPTFETTMTFVHEALHAIHPEWSESYVRRTTTYLIRRMSNEEIQRLYAVVQRRKRVRTKVKRAL